MQNNINKRGLRDYFPFPTTDESSFDRCRSSNDLSTKPNCGKGSTESHQKLVKPKSQTLPTDSCMANVSTNTSLFNIEKSTLRNDRNDDDSFEAEFFAIDTSPDIVDKNEKKNCVGVTALVSNVATDKNRLDTHHKLQSTVCVASAYTTINKANVSPPVSSNCGLSMQQKTKSTEGLSSTISSHHDTMWSGSSTKTAYPLYLSDTKPLIDSQKAVVDFKLGNKFGTAGDHGEEEEDLRTPLFCALSPIPSISAPTSIVDEIIKNEDDNCEIVDVNVANGNSNDVRGSDFVVPNPTHHVDEEDNSSFEQVVRFDQLQYTSASRKYHVSERSGGGDERPPTITNSPLRNRPKTSHPYYPQQNQPTLPPSALKKPGVKNHRRVFSHGHIRYSDMVLNNGRNQVGVVNYPSRHEPTEISTHPNASLAHHSPNSIGSSHGQVSRTQSGGSALSRPSSTKSQGHKRSQSKTEFILPPDHDYEREKKRQQSANSNVSNQIYLSRSASSRNATSNTTSSSAVTCSTYGTSGSDFNQFNNHRRQASRSDSMAFSFHGGHSRQASRTDSIYTLRSAHHNKNKNKTLLKKANLVVNKRKKHQQNLINASSSMNPSFSKNGLNGAAASSHGLVNQDLNNTHGRLGGGGGANPYYSGIHGGTKNHGGGGNHLYSASALQESSGFSKKLNSKPYRFLHFICSLPFIFLKTIFCFYPLKYCFKRFCSCLSMEPMEGEGGDSGDTKHQPTTPTHGHHQQYDIFDEPTIRKVIPNNLLMKSYHQCPPSSRRGSLAGAGLDGLDEEPMPGDCTAYNMFEFYPQRYYMDNYVSTTKYTILSFIPKNLFEQFHRFANLYFLFIVLLNWVPAINAFGKEISMFPVLFVLGVTAIKDLFEDRRRYSSDKRVNNSSCRIFKSDVNEYVECLWKEIKVGDLIKLKCDEMVPADIIVLRSSHPTGLCYIDTQNLDGEANLKLRQVPKLYEDVDCYGSEARVKRPSNLRSDDIGFGGFYAPTFNSAVECDLPTTKIYRFHGSIVHPWGGRIPVGKENILLRECMLKNTDFVEGLVVYAGHETKALLNNGGPRYKRSELERRMNGAVIWSVVILAVLCTIGSLGSGLFLSQFTDVYTPFLNRWSPDTSNPVLLDAFLTFWTFVIILQIIIPLSLYVTIEMAKLLQVFFINHDIEMFDHTTQKGVECRALNITEELGQIQYVFCDKTGTLTENKMIFKHCTIGGRDYGHKTIQLSELTDEDNSEVHDTPDPKDKDKYIIVKNIFLHKRIQSMQIYANKQRLEEQQRSFTPQPCVRRRPLSCHDRLVRDFFLLLAACNTVIIAEKRNSSTMASEDETDKCESEDVMDEGDADSDKPLVNFDSLIYEMQTKVYLQALEISPPTPSLENLSNKKKKMLFSTRSKKSKDDETLDNSHLPVTIEVPEEEEVQPQNSEEEEEERDVETDITVEEKRTTSKISEDLKREARFFDVVMGGNDDAASKQHSASVSNLRQTLKNPDENPNNENDQKLRNRKVHWAKKLSRPISKLLVNHSSSNSSLASIVSSSKDNHNNNTSQNNVNNSITTDSEVETKPVYESESPDELALVDAAHAYGFTLRERSHDKVIVDVPGEGSVSLKLLHVLPFDSNRKRMSVILGIPKTLGHNFTNSPISSSDTPVSSVEDSKIEKVTEDSDFEYVVFTKGADTSIFPRLHVDNAARLKCRGDEAVDELEVVEKTQVKLNEYAKIGLRVLVMGKRVLSEKEYKEWLIQHQLAENALHNRERLLSESYHRVERHLKLLGTTGIEDKLQEGAPQAIHSLRQAGIVVWVLTGDKQETAINIAYSCALFSPDMEIIKLNARSRDSAESMINFHLNTIQSSIVSSSSDARDSTALSTAASKDRASSSSINPPENARKCRSRSGKNSPQHVNNDKTTDSKKRVNLWDRWRLSTKFYRSSTDKPLKSDGSDILNKSRTSDSSVSSAECESVDSKDKKKRALVIDCKTLMYVLDKRQKHLQASFLSLSSHCSSVLCCRTAPLQKAYIVKIVKEQLKVHTLAIGDGANDVSMIQTADVGVGISGQEGVQAVMASDFAISKFRFISRLLLVHGHWNYDRLSRMIKYFFYKNSTFVFVCFWFQFFCGYSGSVMIDQMYLMFFNLLFTSLPPLAIGIFDRDVADSRILGHYKPSLYSYGRLGEGYTHMSFWILLIDAIFQSLIIYFGAHFTYSLTSDVGIWTFGTVLCTECMVVMNLHLAIEVKAWTYLHWLSILLSFLLFFTFALLYNIMCVDCLSINIPYFVMQHTIQTHIFYVINLLVAISAVLPRLAITALWNTIHPSDTLLTVFVANALNRVSNNTGQPNPFHVSKFFQNGPPGSTGRAIALPVSVFSDQCSNKRKSATLPPYIP